MQIRKKINCENKRHLHQSRWAVKCQPRKIVLFWQAEKGADGKSPGRAGTTWQKAEGWVGSPGMMKQKSHPHTHSLWGYWGSLSPCLIKCSKNDWNTSPIAKENPPTLILPWKMPHLHLTRDSPTQRSTWVGQICPCGLGAFECLPRGSNKISIKILNKHMAGEARGIEMPVGAELRGKTSEQTRRTLMIVTALSSKTFIGLHCLLPQNGKKKSKI